MRRQYNVLFESPDEIGKTNCHAEDEGIDSTSGSMPTVMVAIEILSDETNNYERSGHMLAICIGLVKVLIKTVGQEA